MSLTAEIDVIFLEQLLTTKLARRKLNKKLHSWKNIRSGQVTFISIQINYKGQWKSKFVGNENDFKMRKLTIEDNSRDEHNRVRRA